EAKGERFDLRGSILYGVGLASLIYGFSSLPHIDGILCLTAGVLAFVVFILFERKQGFPVFNVRLFSGNKVFCLSSVAALINYAATFAIAFMLSLYLQYVRGLDARHAGLILISQACIQSVCSVLAGYVSNRISPSKLATTGMCISVAGLIGLVFLNIQTPYWLIILLLLLLGIGFGLFSSPNTNVIMSSVEKQYYSQASATTGTMRLAGQAISMGIASMAISLHVGNLKIVPALYPAFMQSMRTTFIVFVILCAVGVYASTARIKPTKA
ncbi:MAG: MFS transporter, partial [Bacteroidales bacterium]|nr:MFS transporter [Bacteroidales bacterium]